MRNNRSITYETNKIIIFQQYNYCSKCGGQCVSIIAFMKKILMNAENNKKIIKIFFFYRDATQMDEEIHMEHIENNFEKDGQDQHGKDEDGKNKDGKIEEERIETNTQEEKRNR